MIAGACARQRKDGHMEENTQKFLERMNELVALGKKKKSILDKSFPGQNASQEMNLP